MKPNYLLILVLGLAAGGARVAHADTTRATGVVETPDAVFFQPSQFSTVVWFFPRTELSLTIVQPQLPTGTNWRAAIVFRPITADDLAMLPPEWAGKAMVPFILRPTTECTLTRLTEMRFVTEDIIALGHDISSANPPVCRFNFRLPTVMTADLQARLDALVNGDTLVQRTLNLDLQVEASIAWADVYAAVADALNASDAGAELTVDQARTAIASALASPALDAVRTAVTASEQEAFVDAALAKLFVPAPGPAPERVRAVTLLSLAATAPSGTVLYHVEPFHRLM
jgi:hypothetical protein